MSSSEIPPELLQLRTQEQQNAIHAAEDEYENLYDIVDGQESDEPRCRECGMLTPTGSASMQHQNDCRTAAQFASRIYDVKIPAGTGGPRVLCCKVCRETAVHRGFCNHHIMCPYFEPGSVRNAHGGIIHGKQIDKYTRKRQTEEGLLQLINVQKQFYKMVGRTFFQMASTVERLERRVDAMWVTPGMPGYDERRATYEQAEETRRRSFSLSWDQTFAFDSEASN